MTASLLYVCVRPQREAAVAEWASFRDGLGVRDDDLVHHDLVREPLPADLDRYAAIVVGGSPFNVTDPGKTDEQRRLERDLERLAGAAIEGRTNALFTCFGIGVVTRLLGGRVSLLHPEGTGPTDIVLTEAGRDDELFGILNPRFEALTAHKEGTAIVPPGATLLAENDACPVQAYRAGSGLWAHAVPPRAHDRGVRRAHGRLPRRGVLRCRRVRRGLGTRAHRVGRAAHAPSALLRRPIRRGLSRARRRRRPRLGSARGDHPPSEVNPDCHIYLAFLVF
ncbi:GMP synthase-like glutamine amidotransferase [Microbacterium testaceum]|uniref:hypothetical protein n=1 Tax=Microbacterium testaceum TaxID=2033 RepID=UPI002781662F|nr:hypothetical protein [Microbacterium testaceum]MDQ1112652.1 GMP synthase-like glutamine amidotransferase [Microbacterium testaceum]